MGGTGTRSCQPTKPSKPPRLEYHGPMTTKQEHSIHRIIEATTMSGSTILGRQQGKMTPRVPGAHSSSGDIGTRLDGRDIHKEV